MEVIRECSRLITESAPILVEPSPPVEKSNSSKKSSEEDLNYEFEVLFRKYENLIDARETEIREKNRRIDILRSTIKDLKHEVLSLASSNKNLATQLEEAENAKGCCR